MCVDLKNEVSKDRKQLTISSSQPIHIYSWIFDGLLSHTSRIDTAQPNDFSVSHDMDSTPKIQSKCSSKKNSNFF